MAYSSPLRQAILRGAWLLVGIMALSFLANTPLAIRPDVLLVGALALAFFIDDVYVFMMWLLAELVWAKYAPSPSYELLFIGIMGIVVFFIIRSFVLRPAPILFIGAILVGTALFWLVFSFAHTFVAFPFLMEFLYNTAVGMILFAFGLWLKKKFS